MKGAMGTMGDGEDTIDFVGTCIRGGKLWADFASNLKPRDIIIRDARFSSCFLARIKDFSEFPQLAGLREVSDAEVAADVRALNTQQQVIERKPLVEPPAIRTISEAVSDADRRFLMRVDTDPLHPLAYYYTAMGIAESSGSKLVRRLAGLDLLSTEKFSRRRGGPVTLCALTLQGRDTLGISATNDGGSGRGHVFHRLWAVQIARHYTQLGWRCEIEAEFRGRQVDILARKNGQVAAVEIVVHSEFAHNLKTVREDLAVFDMVWMYCRTSDQATQVMQGLGQTDPTRNSLELLTALLPTGH